MIEIKKVTKKFGNLTAVNDITLEIKRGEIFGLLGENGAGKTTLLRMMATMLKPTTGEVKMTGFDTVKEGEKVRENIGILFGGETGLYNRLTARENIEYFGKLYDMSKNELNTKISQLAQSLDMTEYVDKMTGKFSKGMKQKTAFARAIVHDPKILLLDEPISGLDVTAILQVHEFIKDCKKEGKTIVLSSHSMDEVQKLCDRVGIIHKGKLVVVDTLDGLKKRYGNEELEQIFTSIVSNVGETK